MGPKWTKEEAIASQARPEHRGKRAACVMNGDRMKFMLNYNHAKIEWCETHTCIVSTDAEG
jgi:hypothetical protein